MKRYVPSAAMVEREWSLAQQRKLHGCAHSPITPQNSEPWSQSPPTSLGDLFRIVDSIDSLAQKWQPRVKHS